MPKINQIIEYDQIKGAIGSLVSLWSSIEKTLTISIGRMHAGEVPKSAHGISTSLDVWSQRVIPMTDNRPLQAGLCQRLVEMLKEALVIRNLVCHGLIGISAQLHLDQPEAHLSVQLGDDTRLLTWSQLDEMFQWMSRTSWLIIDLTDAAMEGDAERANARLHGWEDFPDQK